MVRFGKPETVLVELDKAIDVDDVYAHIEVSHDEVKAEEKIEAAMKEENMEMKYFWGSTLYNFDDLPFKLDGSYVDFNHTERVEKVVGIGFQPGLYQGKVKGASC
ncbi:Rossmann-like alpha/beta/alpha sandwich fold [Sesbania bispinosa]|nr:Rossmann-like alpha/beta/alpha sandwich fold [Sesbania bispinosa]